MSYNDHFTVGTNTSGGDADLSGNADHVHLYRLPHGQYGYSGHVINLPQDVTSFASSLPRLPSELDLIVVRKEGASGSHRDFRVRRHIVHHALQWLISNNIYYRANQVHINQEALALLPQDGTLTNLASIAVESPSTSEQACSANPQKPSFVLDHPLHWNITPKQITVPPTFCLSSCCIHMSPSDLSIKLRMLM